MPQLARAEIESLLRARKLDVTLTNAAPWRAAAADEVAATGIPSLDVALGGGIRRGHLSEIVGPRSAGRTTVMCRALAAAAARGELIALVDPFDRFDPISASAAGLDLARLLWVRDAGAGGTVTLHQHVAGRAVKAMGLVLQAGGFGLVVLDLADATAPVLRQFPFTTWLRLARAIEGSQTAALVVAAEHLARSPGGVTIALHGAGRWTGTSARARLLRGITPHARVVSGVRDPGSGVRDPR
jgi:recA bacterial DNA recombination protein